MPDWPGREHTGSTAAAIHIDYARDTLEELTALVQRWQYHLSRDAIVLLAGGDAPRVLRMLDRPVPLVNVLVFRGPRRPATA